MPVPAREGDGRLGRYLLFEVICRAIGFELALSAKSGPLAASMGCGNAAVRRRLRGAQRLKSATSATREVRPIARGFGRTTGSMRYLSGGAVRTLTTFGRSSEFGRSPKTCQGPDSGWQG